eukprot:gene24100-25776_t
MTIIPFDDRDGWIWMDGHFVPWRDAKVHVLTHGLHYGSCVFEGERLYNGKIFKLTEHTRRLFRSAEILEMEIPFTVEEIDAACIETVARMGFSDAYIRPVAWRGPEQMGVAAQATKTHVAIAAWEWPSYFDPETKRRGIKMMHEMTSFTECFITGSAAEVTPVAEIGDYRFTPGNISLSLMEDYSQLVRGKLVVEA